MSFPSSWARVPVTATYLLRDDSGTPATGRVEFRSAQIVVADGSIIVPVRVTATLDSAGKISLVLPATDDPDIQPNSWTWSVTEVIDRQPRRTYSLAVPHTASSIDLSSIAPIPPGTPVYDYLLTSAIGVTVAGQGDLDALDGRVNALELGAVTLSDATPAPLGTASAGVSTEASRSDHAHEMPTAADISGLGTAATANTTDFATAAQGATAESALQPADGLALLDSAAETKLAGIATGATANATDAQLRDRATHTGTQPHTTITGLGDAATRNVGTTSGTVAAGDDPRLSDERTPTAHTHPSTDISDSTATGRAVLTAADAAAARTALDAPSSAQLAGVQATAEAALPKAGGTMTGPLAIETPTVQPLCVSANLPVPAVPTSVVIGPNSYALLGVAGGGGPYLSGSPYVWLGHPEQAKGKVHCSFGYSGVPVMSVRGPTTASPDPLSQVLFRVGYGHSDATANAFEALTPLNALSAVITNGGHLRTLSNITPITDISASCGDASRRWTQVHAQDGTIQTSDARLKSAVEPLSPALTAIGLQCARETGRFRWLARIAEVGEAARWHIGLTAQRVAEIFALHGEDAYAYGIVCYDTWPERVEIVTPAEYEQRDTGTLDEHGMPVYETVETTPAVMRTIPAGDAYSLRYDELSRLIAAAMIARQDALEARIAALESAT